MYACSKVILFNLFRCLNYKINQLSFSHRQFDDEKIIERNWQRIPIETYSNSSIDSKLSVLLMLCSLAVFSVALLMFVLYKLIYFLFIVSFVASLWINCRAFFSTRLINNVYFIQTKGISNIYRYRWVPR